MKITLKSEAERDAVWARLREFVGQIEVIADALPNPEELEEGCGQVEYMACINRLALEVLMAEMDFRAARLAALESSHGSMGARIKATLLRLFRAPAWWCRIAGHPSRRIDPATEEPAKLCPRCGGPYE